MGSGLTFDIKDGLTHELRGSGLTFDIKDGLTQKCRMWNLRPDPQTLLWITEKTGASNWPNKWCRPEK